MTNDLERRRNALLASIPDEERHIFETYYQERLQQAHQEAQLHAQNTLLGATDPYAVEAELLERLIRDTDAKDDPDHLGLVPTADRECWIEIPLDNPFEASDNAQKAQRQNQNPQDHRKKIFGIGIGVVGLFFFLQSLGVFDGNAASTALATPTPNETGSETPIALADVDTGDAVLFSYPTSLEIADEVFRVVPSPALRGAAWEPELETGVSAWLEGTFVNSVFCLPPTTDIHAVTTGDTILMRPANGTVRTFSIVRIYEIAPQQTEILDQRQAGMTVIVCGTPTATRTVIEAVYQPDRLTSASAQIGETVTFGQDLQVTVRETNLVSTTEQLTDDQQLAISLTIANQGSTTVHSHHLTHQLLVDGYTAPPLTSTLPASIQANATITATLTYTIPAGEEGMWQLTDMTGTSVVVRFSLPAQSARSALRAVIDPLELEHQHVGGEPFLIIPVDIYSELSSTTITTSDIEVTTREGTPLLLAPASSPLPVTVPQASQPETFRLVVPLPDDRTVLVRVGVQRWQLVIQDDLLS